MVMKLPLRSRTWHEHGIEDAEGVWVAHCASESDRDRIIDCLNACRTFAVPALRIGGLLRTERDSEGKDDIIMSQMTTIALLRQDVARLKAQVEGFQRDNEECDRRTP